MARQILLAGWCLFAISANNAQAAITWEPKSLRPFATHTGQFYRYAPSTIVNGATTYCWTCQNQTAGFIKDSIYLTEWQRNQIVLNRPALVSSAPGAWDSYHVCDPSVVAGRFRYGAQRYRYALFYTGNDVNASRHNQVGVAFAKNLDGPWIRYPYPIVAHADDGTWGAGQPSAISLDKAGHVLLFYTCGDRAGTRLFCRPIRLQENTTVPKSARHEMAGQSYCAPDAGSAFESGEEVQLTNAGLTGTTGKADYLNNVDVAYAPRQRRFYAVREQHPYPMDYPRYIGSHLQVVSIAAENVWHGGGSWQVEGEISPILTGLARNHNAGFIRTPTGTLPDLPTIGVIFTASCAGPDCKLAEWSYDLWEIQGKLN